MLRAVLIIAAAAVGSAVAPGVSASAERPDAAVVYAFDGGIIDRDDVLDRDDFDGGNGGDGANG
jgi:hypothetical protein